MPGIGKSIPVGSEFVSKTATIGILSFFASATAKGTISYQWQESRDSTTWNNLTEISPYSGVTNDTLTISNIDYVMYGYQYRVLFINPSYACDSLRISDEAILDIIKDIDEDIGCNN